MNTNQDVSLERTETPPYPTLATDIDLQNKPLPSPPTSIESQEVEDSKVEVADNVEDGDWKEEVSDFAHVYHSVVLDGFEIFACTDEGRNLACQA